MTRSDLDKLRGLAEQPPTEWRVERVAAILLACADDAFEAAAEYARKRSMADAQEMERIVRLRRQAITNPRWRWMAYEASRRKGHRPMDVPERGPDDARDGKRFATDAELLKREPT